MDNANLTVHPSQCQMMEGMRETFQLRTVIDTVKPRNDSMNFMLFFSRHISEYCIHSFVHEMLSLVRLRNIIVHSVSTILHCLVNIQGHHRQSVSSLSRAMY